MAPGHLKSTLAFIAFEMRQNNNERVKDLYFKQLESALARSDALAATFLAIKYARFLIFKCNDVLRACDVLERTGQQVKSSKIFYLSQLNLLKHLEGLGQLPSTPKAAGSRVISTYERAIFNSQLSQSDRQEIATSYLEYIQENALLVSQIKAVE